MGKAQSCVFKCVMGAGTVVGRTDRPGVDGKQVETRIMSNLNVRKAGAIFVDSDVCFEF